jgi:hypothetical protein
LTNNNFTSNEIPDWQGSDAGAAYNFGVYNPPASYFSNEAPELENVAYIERGSISQVLTATLEMDATYALTAKLGDSKADPMLGYVMQLLAGGVVLAETSTPELINDSFSEISVTYTAKADDPIGQALEIRFTENGEDKSSELYIDEVGLTKNP